MSRVLVIDDEPNLLASLTEYLNGEGFEVSSARNCQEARRGFSSQPDAVVLDWKLPDGSGIELVKEWRRENAEIPILMLTARSELLDKVLGLEIGASDYLTKPFEPRELVARINVQLRSRKRLPAESAPVSCGSIEVDGSSRKAYLRKKEVELTKMEFDLLLLFIKNPKKVFTREEILNQVWGYERFPTTRTVDTHVLQLRQKFGAERFETLRGVGYRFCPEEN